MYQDSPEIAAIINRWNEAIRSKDTGTIDNLLSASEQLRYVGTAENESWSGDLLRKGIGAHFKEVPEFFYRDPKIEAFQMGKVGWALWTGYLYFPSTEVLSDYRISFVLALENGSWKIVQMHISNPTSNLEKLGIEHRALEALMAAAENSTLGLGREGMASVMFTDVVDSTTLADLMGDRIWHSRIDAHFQSVQQIVEAAGGTLVKSLGDGTMCTFTSTDAALSAAKNIQNRMIEDKSNPVMRLRIGIHTGEVIENKGDFFGTVVNKAARINAAAQPDEIRVSDATHIMLGRTEGFEFDDPQDVELKGLTGLHRMYRLMY